MALEEQLGEQPVARRENRGDVDLRGPVAADASFPTSAETEARRPGRRRAAAPPRESAAANDDAPSIGGLIYALEQKPSAQPFQYATIGTIVWTLLGSMLGGALLAPEIIAGTSFGALLFKPATVAALGTILIPIALIWFLALLIWRVQELRLMSSAMTEVAIRLAEPDRLAEQQIASLGQSVRRQVSAMNDAISRALGRAGELEALVHNEVAALERSYSENEFRIRNLIDELGSEREALANNSARVSESLQDIGTRVSRDIFAAGDEVAKQLSEAGGSVAHELSERGSALFSSLSVMHQRIGQEVPVLLEKLGQEQTRLTRIVEGAAKNLTALDSALSERTGALDTTLNERTGHLQTVLEEYTSAVENTFATYSQDIERKARALDQSVGSKLAKLDASITETGRIVEGALEQRSAALDAALIERTRAIDTAFGERLRSFEVEIARGMRGFEDAVTHGSDSIDQAIASRTHALREAMENHGRSLRDVLERQSDHLDSNLVQGIEAVRRASEVISNQSIQAIGGLSMQSKVLKEVSEGLLDQIHQLTSRFENQSQGVLQAAKALEHSQDKVGTVLNSRQAELERLRAEADRQAQSAFTDLKSRYTSVSRELSDQMTSLKSHVHSAATEVEERARQAASEVEGTRALLSQSAGLPVQARETAESVRRTLQEQMRAIEALEDLSRGAQTRRDLTPAEPAGGYPLPGPPRPPAPAHRPADLYQQAAMPPSGRAGGHHDHGGSPAPAPRRQSEAWTLGDLLARASEDEDHRKPAAMPTGSHGEASSRPLDLTNIAAAIDVGTAADIWSRYRSGERGLFNRQLYSRQGQMTFDEITRRLKIDAGFRNMAERYLADFERLLAEAEQKDQSGRTVQHHLVAETGRVYLLLAHASGRLA